MQLLFDYVISIEKETIFQFVFELLIMKIVVSVVAPNICWLRLKQILLYVISRFNSLYPFEVLIEINIEKYTKTNGINVIQSLLTSTVKLVGLMT